MDEVGSLIRPLVMLYTGDGSKAFVVRAGLFPEIATLTAMSPFCGGEQANLLRISPLSDKAVKIS